MLIASSLHLDGSPDARCYDALRAVHSLGHSGLSKNAWRLRLLFLREKEVGRERTKSLGVGERTGICTAFFDAYDWPQFVAVEHVRKGLNPLNETKGERLRAGLWQPTYFAASFQITLTKTTR